jgi:outer membrane protein TolC
VAAYQQTVLSAAQEVENGLVTFLRARERTNFQDACAKDAEKAVQIVQAQYDGGTVDLTPVTLLQQTLVQQQDVLVQAQGEIATGLIQVYRALGGGWQIRCTDCQPKPLSAESQPAKEAIPSSTPNPAPPIPEPKAAAKPQ